MNLKDEIRQSIIVACAQYHTVLLDHQDKGITESTNDAVLVVDEATTRLLKLFRDEAMEIVENSYIERRKQENRVKGYETGTRLLKRILRTKITEATK